jgi:hypothetical protein
MTPVNANLSSPGTSHSDIPLTTSNHHIEASTPKSTRFLEIAVVPPTVSITKWGTAELMPNFSTRVIGSLNKGRIIEEWHTFIAECAYQILSNGDMMDKIQYCDFGRAVMQTYPCVASNDGQQPWVSNKYCINHNCLKCSTSPS